MTSAPLRCPYRHWSPLSFRIHCLPHHRLLAFLTSLVPSFLRRLTRSLLILRVALRVRSSPFCFPYPSRHPCPFHLVLSLKEAQLLGHLLLLCHRILKKSNKGTLFGSSMPFLTPTQDKFLAFLADKTVWNLKFDTMPQWILALQHLSPRQSF